jgi:serine/threonine-protein kinase
VVFVSHPVNSSPDTIELLAGDKRVLIVRVEGQRLWNPRYCASGHIVYRRAGQNSGVWAVPFDIDKLEVTGEPFLIAADASYPSVADDGSLVYLRGASDAELVLRWVDRSGVVGDSVTTRETNFAVPALSPDETRLAVTSNDGDETDIWIHDLERGTRTRFTFAEGPQIAPAWSPDGSQIYFQSIGADSIFVRSSDGTGKERAVVRGRGPDVSNDGRFLLYFVQGGKTQEDIWYVGLEEGAEPTPFLVTPARETGPQISPDGRYVLYESNESGEFEVYVKRFPSGEGKWQVSIDGGEYPEWGKSGDTIYYRGDGCDIYEVPCKTENNLVLGTPVKIVDCDKSGLVSGGFKSYTVAGDGERVIMMQAVTTNRNTIDVGITVVQNWPFEFAAREVK